MSDAAKQVDFDTNPYEVLGLGAGSPTLSAEDIKKVRPGCFKRQRGLAHTLTPRLHVQAYRKRALALHPDKRPQAQRSGARSTQAWASAACSSPHSATSLLSLPFGTAAEREFNELQKAYDLLWCVLPSGDRTHASTSAHSALMQ